VETQEYSSHVNLGFETTRRARSSDGLKLVWGCLLTDGDFTKWRQAMRNTRELNSRSMLCVVSKLVRFEIYATLPAGPRDVIYQMIRFQFRKFDSHSRETAELEEQ